MSKPERCASTPAERYEFVLRDGHPIADAPTPEVQFVPRSTSFRLMRAQSPAEGRGFPALKSGLQATVLT